MDGTRDQLLAGSGLAGDEHRCIGSAHLTHLSKDVAEGGTLTDDVFEPVRLEYFLAQEKILLLQPLLQLLNLGKCQA